MQNKDYKRTIQTSKCKSYACKLLCVQLLASRITRFANNLGIRILRFLHFIIMFVYIKEACTSNMASWFYARCNDTTEFYHVNAL